MSKKIIVFDLGGQYAHLIWRNFRDLECDVLLVKKDLQAKKVLEADAFVISGGPSSVTKDSYGVCEMLLAQAKAGTLGKPILGICLGHQLIAHRFGGRVQRGASGEYGITKIIVHNEGALLKGMGSFFNAWASHFDTVSKAPEGFSILASAEGCACEAMENINLNVFSTQFHPEVWHTQNGVKIFQNFLNTF